MRLGRQLYTDLEIGGQLDDTASVGELTVTRFLASTDKPKPGKPMKASAMSSISCQPRESDTPCALAIHNAYQQLYNLFDVGILFCFRHMRWLSEIGAELERFANRRRILVLVLLLGICERLSVIGT